MLSPDVRVAVNDFLQRWDSSSPRSRARLGAKAPIAEIQEAALHHDDPWARRRCLAFLDHSAADASAAVFLEALDDPVAPVRDLALHGLACEQCRTEELCTSDVTPRVAAVLKSDPNPEVRYKAIPILRRLATREPGARLAIERAATNDPDERVREAAAAILRGERPRRWNQFCRTLASGKAKRARTA